MPERSVERDRLADPVPFMRGSLKSLMPQAGSCRSLREWFRLQVKQMTNDACCRLSANRWIEARVVVSSRTNAPAGRACAGEL